MKENIINRGFKDKFLLKINPIIQSNDSEEFSRYITGNKSTSDRNKNSLKFLQWIKSNNHLPDAFSLTLSSEIEKLIKQQEELKLAFYNLKSKSNVSAFLNIKVSQLNYILYVLSDFEKYTEFSIAKRRGGERTIFAPRKPLKYLQRRLNEVLQICYSQKLPAHGFITGKSILSNSVQHIKKRNVLNLDLKDFFPSINFGRVRGLFLKEPFNFNEEVATILAQISCAHNQLPQGAPSSPIISNMICSRLDQKLMKLAQKYYCTYTRYADDITFSNTKRNLPENLVEEISQIIREEGFEVNEAKVRNQPKIMRQEVTGLTVNEKVNINRKYIRNVRAILHSWEKEGYRIASKKFFGKFDRHRFIKPSLSNSLKGKIEFIGSIRGKDDELFNKLSTRYSKLTNDPNIKAFESNKERDKLKKETLKIERTAKIKRKWQDYDKRLAHNPKQLVIFLQLFSNPAAYLRNLVHKNYFDDNFDLPSLLKEARNEYNFKKINLPSFIRSLIEQKLFLNYKKNGLYIWEKDKKSPLVADEQFYKQIQGFKRKYRFGKADSEETNLLTEIRNMIKEGDLSNLIGKIEIDGKVEDAYFYTDVDAVIIAIRKIFNMFLRFGKEEDYKVKITYYTEGEKKILELCHIGTRSYTSVEDFKKRIDDGSGELGEMKCITLKSRCDWQIEAKFTDGLYRVKILDSENQANICHSEELPELKYDNSFTHKLIFI